MGHRFSCWLACAPCTAPFCGLPCACAHQTQHMYVHAPWPSARHIPLYAPGISCGVVVLIPMAMFAVFLGRGDASACALCRHGATQVCGISSISAIANLLCVLLCRSVSAVWLWVCVNGCCPALSSAVPGVCALSCFFVLTHRPTHRCCGLVGGRLLSVWHAFRMPDGGWRAWEQRQPLLLLFLHVGKASV